MSVYDHFDNTSDAGFTRSWSPSSARRQFQMSLILIGALVCSAVVLASTLRFDAPLQEGRSVAISHKLDRSATLVAPYAGKLAPIDR